MNTYSIFSYIYYLCRSRSEYYVHSPYVYSLMQKCLRSRSVFKAKNAALMCSRIENHVKKEGLSVKLVGKHEDLSSFLNKPLSPREVIVVEAPHFSRRREEDFDALCGREDVRLSIDTFFTGIVFPPRDMEKEHFILNYF